MRNYKKIILLVFCLFLFFYHAHCQYYTWGSEPTLTSWRQIKTEHFQVIYPKECDSIAQMFTNKLEFVYSYVTKSLEHEPSKISVIIHNQTNTSNGSVVWCPKQMDVYTIPSQSQHVQEWYDNLAIHELRHVVQTDKLNQGLTQIFSILLGQQSVGLVAGLYLPMWLLEGDAVCSETAFSMGGRGRQATFSMGLRAQMYDKGIFSYSKAYLGSYKDYVPNYYEMGYFFLANTRKLYGQHFEENCISRAGRNPFCLRPINCASKQKTALSRRNLYDSIFVIQANEWKLKHDREIPTKFDTISPKTHVYSDYLFGLMSDDSCLFAQKSSLKSTSQLVKINGNKEKKIANIAFKTKLDRLYSNGKTIIWSENNYSIRWEQKDKTYIYMYDIENDKIHRLNTKRHLFSPAISPSNERIVAVEVDEKGKNYLAIFDKKSCKSLKRIVVPDNDEILQPAWNEIGSKIVFIGLNSQGKRLMEYDIQSDAWLEILPYSNEDYNSPVFWRNYLLYSSSYSGIDNIYAVERNSKEIFRVTVAEFGCKYPSVSDSCMIFSNYTSDGFQLAKMKLNPKAWHSISVVKKDNCNLAQMLTNQEGGTIDFSMMPDTTYESKYYSKLLHSFNIHSWSPFLFDYSNDDVEEVGTGIQFLSQNNLGTTFISGGYKWNKSEQTKDFFANVTYRGLFPVFEISLSKGTKDYEYVLTERRRNDTINYQYATTTVQGRMYVPFNFSSKSYYRYLIPNVQFEYYGNTLSSCPTQYKNNFYNTVNEQHIAFTCSFSNLKTQAKQELEPRWGQSVLVGCEQSLSPASDLEVNYMPYYFAVSKFYFPGFVKTHSFNVYGAVEYSTKKENYYNYSRQISTPRGVTESIPLNEYFVSLKANYEFPILYPDFELGDFLYVQRVKCLLFSDYAFFTNTSADYFSIGGECTFDFHIFTTLPSINCGVRSAYIPQNKNIFAELLLSASIDN